MSSSSRVVGLDIGSNTFSCVELNLTQNGSPVVTRDTSRPVRLSTNLKSGGLLDRMAVYRGLDTLEELFEEFQMDKCPTRVVGTQALRMTSKPEDFTDQAREILGVGVEILTGEEEALLASRGAILNLPRFDSWVIVDIGGQSTEICWKDRHSNWKPVSLPVGVVSLTEQFLRSDPPAANQLDALGVYVSKLLDSNVPANLTGHVVGVAGTATTLGLLELGLTRWEREKVHGSVVGMNSLDHWLSVISGLCISDRSNRFGISTSRSDIFPAGLSILRSVLQHLGKDRLIVSANGLRVGAALSIVEEE